MGCLGDLGIHKLDLIRWIMNSDFTEASAFIGTLDKQYPNGNKIDVEDNALAILKSENDSIGTLITSWTYRKEDNSTIFYCQKGVLGIYTHPDFDIIIDLDHERSEYYRVGGKSTNVKQLKSGIIDEFVSHILNDTDPSISGYEGFKALQAVLACLESAENGKTIRII
jgi:predicted dehydrogenase